MFKVPTKTAARGNRGLPTRDITGKRYGKLVAEAPWGWIDDEATWICRCDCGGVCIRALGNLVRDVGSSCMLGTCHHRAKLSDAVVECIRQDYANGYGWKRLTARYGIAKTSIRNIVAGRFRNGCASEFTGPLESRP